MIEKWVDIEGYEKEYQIDEDKNNNNVNNLEWCSHKYNMNYGKVREKISKSKIGKEPWNKGLKMKGSDVR